MKAEIDMAREKDDFLLNIMTLWIWKGKNHYNHMQDKQQHKEWQCLTNGWVFQRVLIQLRHHVYIKFDPVSLGSSIYFHGLFGLSILLGTSPVLKSTANCSFHPGHFQIYKVSNIWIYHIFNHCLFGPFLIPFEEYFSISLLLPFFTYVKKHSYSIFIFHGRI